MEKEGFEGDGEEFVVTSLLNHFVELVLRLRSGHRHTS